MGHYVDALTYGELGLEQARAQNMHFCDEELQCVLVKAKKAIDDLSKNMSSI